MAKSTKQAKKNLEKPAVRPAPATPRKLKKATYKSFQLQKRIKPDKKLPGAFRLFARSIGVLKRHWKLFLGITLTYGVLNFVLVQGLSTTSTNTGQLKDQLDQLFTGDFGALTSSATLFFYLLSNAGSNVNPTGGSYQFILTITASLAFIWALRKVYTGEKIKIRQAFYFGMYPLVPFLLVMMVFALQLVPVVVGAYLYSNVIDGQLALTVIERVLWGGLVFLGGVLSLYLVSSSVFALYVVSLPDMTPMRALRSARQLVRYRRAAVMRKVLFLPIALLVVSAVIMLPLILLAPAVAGWAFLFLSMCLLAGIHSYMYTLYRALL